MGFIIGLVVLAADIQDVLAARVLLSGLAHRLMRLRRIWADGGYTGTLIGWVAERIGCVLEIVRLADKLKGFQVLPHRWVVERTFAWLGKYRRLSKDYESDTQSSETWIYIAMIHIMVRRLAPSPKAASP